MISLKKCMAASGIATALLLFGCNKEQTASVQAQSHDAPQQKTTADSVELEEGMLRSIRLEKIEQRPAPRVLTLTGKVSFNEDQTGRIVAPVAGQIMELGSAHRPLKLGRGNHVAKESVRF